MTQIPLPASVFDPSTCRPVSRRLTSAFSATDVLRTLRDERHPVALSGSWFASRAVVASDPLRVADGRGATDPFALLDTAISIQSDGTGVHGGWIGNLGYRCGTLVERLPAGPPRPVATSDWWLGFYDNVLRLDADGAWWFEALWTPDRSEPLEARYEDLARRLSTTPPSRRGFSCGPFVTVPSASAHRVAVGTTIEHIEAGDIYQANVCMRMESALAGDALDLFAAGTEALDPPYAAYIGQGARQAVASLSPERFLRREGGSVSTCPIKGTRRRLDGDDGSTRTELAASAKDRAENVMIVDLMRNDLGRVCVPGSVSVPRLFDVEAHPGVWHLVSEVRGRLAPGVGDGALLRATFPPGSVTGAPKIRAMEIIAEVESTAREAYTGAVGMVSAGAGAEWNVAIRTFEVAAGQVWLGVGGGIVADSDPAAELEECRTKARPLLAAVGAALDT